MELREYQKQAILKARESFKKGNKRIALCLSTGAGKSLIAKEIVKSFRLKSPNGKIGYFTFRNVLIKQMEKTLNGLDVEIGTLQKFGKCETEIYDLVIIDEVHYANDSKLQNNIKSKYVIGLTATPINSYGNALEFDEIIDVIQLVDLIELGYASPVKVLSTTKVDTSKLKSVGGDFNQKEAYELMSKSQIKKDIVEVYKKYASGLKTIVYAVNIKHCEELLKEFLENGINADSIHSKKNDTELSLKRFGDNEIDVLINVDVLTTGYDAPDIYCLILASPTKSLIKSTQIYGRATRLNPLDNDKVALIIDCANVIENTQHPLQRFDFTKTKKDTSKICKCGLKMKLTDRKILPNSEYEYIVRSDYKCDCGLIDTVENLKLINIEQCEGCGQTFKSNGIVLNNSDKSLSFDLSCVCGHTKPFREIVYTNDEMKEITIQNSINNMENDWNSLKNVIKSECKKCGYHHRYSERIMDHIKNRNLTIIEVSNRLKQIITNGKKVSALMYI